jgi:hypothetical protein
LAPEKLGLVAYCHERVAAKQVGPSDVIYF